MFILFFLGILSTLPVPPVETDIVLEVRARPDPSTDPPWTPIDEGRAGGLANRDPWDLSVHIGIDDLAGGGHMGAFGWT